MSVIDLCSSDEDDDPSPRKSALDSFAPRKEKIVRGGGSSGGQHGGNIVKTNGQNQLPQNHPQGSTPRAQQARPSGTPPANTVNGYNVGLANGSGSRLNNNYVSHTPRATAERSKNSTNGEKISPYHNGAPGGSTLAALLAGVAENDNESLEQLRSSMGKRGFLSPQADQRRSGGIDKSERYQDRRVSGGLDKIVAPYKAQPRKSDAVVKPFQQFTGTAPSRFGDPRRSWVGNNATSIPPEPRSVPQSAAPPRVEPSKEHAYSGAGLTIRKSLAAAPDDTNPAQNFKRSIGPISSNEASEISVKRRRTDGGVPTLRESVTSTTALPQGRSSFVDRTDPATERLTYSDEPDLPAPRSFQRNPTTGSAVTANPTRPATTVSNVSLERELEAQVSADATSLRQSDPNPEVLTRTASVPILSPARPVTAAAGKRNAYSHEDRQLMKRLKEVEGLPWDEIIRYFPGRSLGSIQVHYSTRVKGQRLEPAQNVPARPQRTSSATVKPVQPAVSRQAVARDTSPEQAAPVRKRRVRGGGPSAMDGFVSWPAIRNAGRESTEGHDTSAKDDSKAHPSHLLRQDRAHSSSESRILRLRELGLSGSRAWGRSPQRVREELKNHVVKGHTIQKQYHGTSGDVVALAWSANDDRFVAGSIAISDATSMQYNMSRNLLLGDADTGELRELVEHHIPRPVVADEKNVNGLHAMRESQDSRLFLTVTAAGFSSEGDKLYTAGTDKQLRMYSTQDELSEVECRYVIPHTASVDSLSLHAQSAVATGCHSASSNVNVYSCSDRDFIHSVAFSPSRRNLEVSVPIYPSSLKWGRAHHHRNYLLAGFAGDEEKAHAGETCLWDVTTGQSVDLRTATRNVFDVAWNPFPSPASVAFAVAALSTGTQVSKGTRSVVHLFAPKQQYARRVKTLECRANDLNDVVFCPHDDNLVATGSADGTVYVWDQRGTDMPLHTLEHGRSVLVEDSPDTGVRFLSWGATASRIYSGSSDGIVKVWNPCRSETNTHIDDIAAPRHQRSAVMSAAFNSDYRELLIGTENGRIDLFSVGGQTRAKPQQFKLHTAPAPEQEGQEPFEAARSLIATEQIELRPYGEMPFRQAVQGPNYSGPFLAPSTEETMQAEAAYQKALTLQHEASMRRAAQMIDQDDDEDVLKASKKVQEAQRTIDDLQERLEHFNFAQPKAEQFQRSLLIAEDSHDILGASGLITHPCDLDCNFLPGADDIEDSSRSELRIPGMLRSVDLHAVRAMNEEADNACAMCYPTNMLNRHGVRTYCSSCSLKRANLTTACSQCSAPARVEIDKTKPTLCEVCSFACFRCGQTADLDTNDDGMNIVTCTSCALVWEADVLGYQLVSSTGEGRRQPRLSSDDVFPTRIGRHWDVFADGEREHYASLWEDKPQNDW